VGLRRVIVGTPCRFRAGAGLMGSCGCCVSCQRCFPLTLEARWQLICHVLSIPALELVAEPGLFDAACHTARNAGIPVLSGSLPLARSRRRSFVRCEYHRDPILCNPARGGPVRFGAGRTLMPNRPGKCHDLRSRFTTRAREIHDHLSVLFILLARNLEKRPR